MLSKTQIERLENERASKIRAARNLIDLIEQGGVEDDGQLVARYNLRLAEAKQLENELEALKAENLDVEGIVAVMRSLAKETRKEVLDAASNKRLNALYDALGIEVEYLPDEESIRLNLAPTGTMRRQQALHSAPENPENTDNSGGHR